MIYKFEWGKCKYGIDAEIVGKQCQQIEKEKGCVTRAALLDSARDNESAIHNLFEWNDGIAAENYRLHQAGNILSSLKITVVNEEKEEKQVRAFVQIAREDKKAIYVNTCTALSDESTREYVLKTALNELQAFRQKYNTLSELAPVFAAIDALEVG